MYKAVSMNNKYGQYRACYKILKVSKRLLVTHCVLLPRVMADPPPCMSCMVKGSPIPSSKLNSGPPKQALNPVLGEPRLAIVVSAIMSPIEFPDWSRDKISPLIRQKSEAKAFTSTSLSQSLK